MLPQHLQSLNTEEEGELYAFHLLYILTVAGSKQTQQPFRTPDRRIPMHSQGTTEAGGAERDWHLGRVKVRGGGRRAEE